MNKSSGKLLLSVSSLPMQYPTQLQAGSSLIDWVCRFSAAVIPDSDVLPLVITTEVLLHATICESDFS